MPSKNVAEQSKSSISLWKLFVFLSFFSIFLGSKHANFVAIWDQKGHGPTLAMTLALKQACFGTPLVMFTMVLGITLSGSTRKAWKVARKLVSPNVRPIANAKASILSWASACWTTLMVGTGPKFLVLLMPKKVIAKTTAMLAINWKPDDQIYNWCMIKKCIIKLRMAPSQKPPLDLNLTV